jgi:hypothetical protein
MDWIRPKTSLVASLGLIAAGLTLVGTASPAAAAPFVERWCSKHPAPCVISASLNGAPMHAGDPLQIQMIPTQSEAADNYTEFLIQDPTNTVHLTTTATVSVLVDLGHLKPESTQNYASRPVVDRIDDHDGTYKMRITGKPVVLTTGCTDTYPNFCSDKATTQATVFDVTILQLKENREFVGSRRTGTTPGSRPMAPPR